MFFHHKIKHISLLPFDLRSSVNTHYPSLQAVGILFIYLISTPCLSTFTYIINMKIENETQYSLVLCQLHTSQSHLGREKFNWEKCPYQIDLWYIFLIDDWLIWEGSSQAYPCRRILSADMDRLRYVGSWLMGRIQTFCNGKNWAVQSDWPIRMRIQMRGSNVYTVPSSS